VKEVAETEKYKAPSICPVCGGEYEITSLTCKSCKSELNGRFEGCEYCALDESEKSFLSTFIKCRGNIREVEKELGISYPTVRHRLDNIISRLGYENRRVAQVTEERKIIIKRLEDGEITADEAAEALRSLK
jgi:hypothetical protein